MREELMQHSPISRMGMPEDLAYAVLYLASDESTYVSGQLLSIDGGQLAHLPHFAFLKATGARTTVQK
jgi:NAD(P)-dependent dehydrogenase (short-subunit alcohol dehydrogenase family)